MQKILFSVITLLLVHSLTAQVTRERREGYRAINPEQQPLVIVDSVITDFNHLLLKPDKIVSMDILKDAAAISGYGEKAKFGVIIIKTKKNSGIVQVNELLDYYNIPQEERKLKICLDHILVKDNQKLVTDKDDIETVEITTDTCWISPTEPGPGERYINIVSKREKKIF